MSFRTSQPRWSHCLPFLLAGSITASAAPPPSWWLDPGAPVVVPNSNTDSQNNHGMANIGQAKWVAKNALAALNLVLPTVASQVESDLSTIVDFSVPSTPDDEWRAKQRAPLMVGQLKAMAAPFYTRLHAVAPDWLVVQLKLNGTYAGTGNHYPWPATSTSEANHAVATIGQLKAVFGLKLDLEPSDTLDSDSDGTTDVDEEAEGTMPSVEDNNKDVKLNVIVIPD